jgi:hypothetical protein
VADVWVRRGDLEAGELPSVCAVTGEATDRTVRFRFDSVPTWTWLLLFFGVFPFLIASFFATEKVEGQVPVVPQVIERYHRLRRRSFVLGGTGVALVAIAFVAVRELVWVGLAAIAFALVVGIIASRSFINGRLDDTGRWVKMTRVHPAFVHQLEVRGQTPVEH